MLSIFLGSVNTPGEILTVLTLHEMNLEESPAYATLCKALEATQQKGRMFIYDNSAAAQAVPVNHHWMIDYTHDATNPGVSRAYNQALLAAKQHHLKWMLLADQDTHFPINIYDCYSRSVNSHPDCKVFSPVLIDSKGVLSPFQVGTTSGKRFRKIIPGKKSLEEVQSINSGLLIDVALFETVGGYDELFRLDFSDFNFFKRLKQFTNNIIIVDALCRHEHSSTEKTTVNKALNRFKIYLEGSALMSRGNSVFLFQFRALLRAVKLSLQYRSSRFIGSFLHRE